LFVAHVVHAQLQTMFSLSSNMVTWPLTCSACHYKGATVDARALAPSRRAEQQDQSIKQTSDGG